VTYKNSLNLAGVLAMTAGKRDVKKKVPFSGTFFLVAHYAAR
jgi:hypothetical protein